MISRRFHFFRSAIRNPDALKFGILPYPPKAMLQYGDFPSIENQIQPRRMREANAYRCNFHWQESAGRRECYCRGAGWRPADQVRDGQGRRCADRRSLPLHAYDLSG
ncbi:conserved hypothetical protein [Agrobacterium fabacearum CFBP 5771]|nr:conserved hypothetical protein [Agrobacterium fabacearum CFBP 5771]